MAGALFLIIAALILWRCRASNFLCFASNAPQDEANGKNVDRKWSMMLQKRPLPRLPPEAKHKKNKSKGKNKDLQVPTRVKSIPNPYETDAYESLKKDTYTYPNLNELTGDHNPLHYQELDNKNQTAPISYDTYEVIPAHAYSPLNDGGKGEGKYYYCQTNAGASNQKGRTNLNKTIDKNESMNENHAYVEYEPKPKQK